ncbi:beta-lactamase family protein [Paenibacillus sp. TRM 82003]|uniref:serine hydrolase domain-containing protein n=1 Tax=Kineococcus sp. TRM81007 TaxID=2925831 RepID=UPI001F595D12|nr:serine hydrolase domain-containing protein [Kineococcus sp. TRM81007]MCI2238562.1 beta-lactamase family protein [Kineococcus sp. TRM81007]MCI3920645.1 beta-lactamase family protein [Paenibacillus sp. TRM 82003]
MTTAPASPPSVLPTTARSLEHVLAAAQAEHRLPSVVVGVVRGGELVWTGAAGTAVADPAGTRPPTVDTQYRIGSITKTFVAAGVLRCVEDGLAGLDDPLSAHLTELGTGGVGALTVGQLLGQASGLQAETDGPWWERTPGGDWRELLPLLGPGALRHRAGVRFHYSNVGYGVLGELLGRLRGAAWDEVVAQQFLGPLGMDRTSTRPQAPAAQGFAVHPWADTVLPEPEHDAGAMAPAGQLWSTVPDLARWAGVVADGSGVLRRETAEAMRQPQVVDDARGAAWGAGYGLGLQLWNADGRRFAGHSGSMPGFVAMLRVDVETSDAVLALTNSTTGFGDLPVRLLTAFTDAEPAAPRPWRPRPVDADVLELLGPWYWGPAPLVLRAGRDGSLELSGLTGRARASRFGRDAATGAWRGLDEYYAGEVLRPVRGADGSVSHLDLASFRLTRTPYDPEGDVPGGVDPAGWRP